jgi:threonine aldolase
LIDLRSDTVTKPTPEMRRAMADAAVGDDVYGEDPTVNRLEQRAADLMGTEEALFVSSGTMGNLLGLLVNATAGQEVIVDSESHIFRYEGGGPGALAGVQLRPVVTERGVISADEIDDAIRPTDEIDEPTTAVFCLENTHNRHGGICWPIQAIESATHAARRRGLKVHLDGARIFNAAIALNVSTADIAQHADTLSFCLSKGLGCPVGSVFCGSSEAIDKARRWRKMLGGGWRQAGVIAAAGLWALDHMVERLAEDHGNARTLAEGLAELPGIAIDASRVETNIVIFHVTAMSSQEFVAACRERGVLGGGYVSGRVRFVTHHGITAIDIQRTLDACTDVLSALVRL